MTGGVQGETGRRLKAIMGRRLKESVEVSMEEFYEVTGGVYGVR